jgi:hypothetical protein
VPANPGLGVLVTHGCRRQDSKQRACSALTGLAAFSVTVQQSQFDWQLSRDHPRTTLSLVFGANGHLPWLARKSLTLLCFVHVRVCRRQSPRVPLVALDMDGTLLDSSSNISPDSAQVIRAAAAAGVQVILATGKARPAAIAAARKAHLEGDALLVSHRKPGVFLQVGSGAPCPVCKPLFAGYRCLPSSQLISFIIICTGQRG